MSFRNLTQVAGVTRQVPLLAEPYRQPHLLFDTQSLTSLELTEVRQAWLPRSPRNPPPQSYGDACNHNYLFLHAPGEYMAALDLQGKHITKLLHHHHPQSWFLTRIEVCHINEYQDIFQFFFLAKQTIITFFWTSFISVGARICPSQSYWRLKPDSSLSCACSISTLYPLDARSTFSSSHYRSNSSRHCQMSPQGRSLPK